MKRVLGLGMFLLIGLQVCQAADCRPETRQSLTGTMSEATETGDGTWFARVEAASPCSIQLLQGKGRPPAACAAGHDFGVKRFAAEGITDLAGTLVVAQIQCSK